MSIMIRNFLTVLTAVSMAIFFFLAGYVARDHIGEREKTTTDVSMDAPGMTLFGEAWEKIDGQFMGELPDETALNHAVIRGALSSLNDPYTIFLEPEIREEEKEDLRGSFGGIGVLLKRLDNGEVELEPIPDNPAANAGILSGDILLALDGEPILFSETTGQIAERIKGENGSSVMLTIRHPNERNPADITIERADILIPSVTSRILREDKNIGYIQLSSFTGESGEEMAAAIQTLLAQNATQFVLDLRGNGGGLLDAATDVTDHFLDDEIVFYHNSRRDGERTERTNSDSMLPDLPLTVLMDGGTASASEIVAGALQDHGRAILIGEKTYGKGSVQLVYDLSDASSIHVTWARWFTPDRKQLDQNGLDPDIEVRPSQTGVENGRDEPLERAINYLQTGS